MGNMSDVSRRSFMGIAGAAALSTVLSGSAFAEEGTAEEQVIGAPVAQWTPPEAQAMGDSWMPVEEINRRRHEIVDATGDCVKSDGAVVPAVFNKVWALINTYSFGVGDSAGDKALDWVLETFSEEDAQAYLEMPFGIDFSAANYAEESGRSEEECAAILDNMYRRGLVGQITVGDVQMYHHAGMVFGIFEFTYFDMYEGNYAQTWVDSWSNPTHDGGDDFMCGGIPIEYAIPCNKEIVADEEIIVGDDWRKIVERNETIAVVPCACRMLGRKFTGLPNYTEENLSELVDEFSGHYLETCLLFGDEARYYIEVRGGRQITQEECVKILERSLDEGCILQAGFTRNCVYICSCHGNSCGVLGAYLAMDVDDFNNHVCYKNLSHYTLEYDRDACISCGACIERCPMFAIEMDEDNHPAVTGRCMRCGQCATVCPVGARKLAAVPKEDCLDRPFTFLEQYNKMAGYRMEHGLL